MSEHEGTRADRLAAALDELIRSSSDVEAAAVVSFDGLSMSSALPAGIEEDRVAAMSAALLSLGGQATERMGRGTLNTLFVEGRQGFMFLMSADGRAVLTVLAARAAKMGFVLFEMRRAVERIGRILAEGSGGTEVAERPTVADGTQGPGRSTVADDEQGWQRAARSNGVDDRGREALGDTPTPDGSAEDVDRSAGIDAAVSEGRNGGPERPFDLVRTTPSTARGG